MSMSRSVSYWLMSSITRVLVGHLSHHAVVVLEAESLCLEPFDFLGRLTRAESFRIGKDFQLLDVTAVRVYFKEGEHVAPLVIVAMREFVSGRYGLHADFPEKLLVVVSVGTTHEEHGQLSFAS